MPEESIEPLFNSLAPPYATIVADPPWDLRDGWNHETRNCLGYSLLTLDEIKALPVRDIAARSAHVYLWATTKVLRHSFEIIEAWGFNPKQILVWCKPGLGSGHRFRPNTEYVVFGTRGPGLPITRHDVGTWHQWPRGAHSVKPSGFGDLVESISPGPYVELFARQPRLGWDSWGHGHEGMVIANAG